MPAPLLTFEGTSDADNLTVVGGQVVPPDTNGDVGPDHYVQWNNLVYQVFDKTGASALGPLPGNAIFSGFGGPCETTNNGDPIVLYDRAADRWFLTQFAIDDGVQCIAVSQTSNATGAYNRYAFAVTPGGFNDYPKFGIWPTATNSAYFATFRRFPGFAIVAAAFERDKMLAGDPAQVVLFTLPAPAGAGCAGAGDCYEGVLPAHADGATPPADGSPGVLVMSFDDEAFSTLTNAASDSYKLWKFAVDWTTPASSTLTGPTTIDAPEMDIALCGFGPCVPQKDSAELLDHLSFFTMNRAVFRKFGDHEALFVNNTVNLGASRAGVRWAELRDPIGIPTLHQTGTHGPADDVHRWMGSINVDRRGNVALGYSASGTDLFPSIRYAGRLAHDPLGTLPQTESELYAGTGSQTGSFGRWGDYSAMSIDPTDDCTFWFTSEYYQTTSAFNFHTRIGSFKFPNCSADPSGVISGHITKAGDGTPLAGAEVRAAGSATVTDATGAYTLELPVGTYDVMALAYGYLGQASSGVAVTDGGTTTLDFRLAASTLVSLRGTVLDGSGAGWPLYARVVITPTVGPVTTLFTNPTTGHYALNAFANADYTISATAMGPGYQPGSRVVSVAGSDQVEDFTLFIDPVACVAAGYGFVPSASLVSENFDGGIPGTWTVVNGTTSCAGGAGGLWNTDDVQGRGNLTGGSALFAEANADVCGPTAAIDTDLESPEFDLSAVGGSQRLLVSFNSDYVDLCSGADSVSVDVWNGSAWITARDFCGLSRPGPRVETFSTSAVNGVANAKLRFHYKADWDWFWAIDNVSASVATCQFGGGGVIVGNVTDANTTTPLDDARVSLDTGQSTTTAPTPADESVPDGFYLLYAPAGDRTLTVSRDRYATQNIPLTITGGVVRRDVALTAGRLTSTPDVLRKRVELGKVGTSTLTLSNTGTAPAGFKLNEIDAPAPAPVMRPAAAFRPQLPYDPTTAEGQAASVALKNPSPAGPHARGTDLDIAALPIVPRAGESVDAFATGLQVPWGIGFNTDAANLWVSNAVGAVGDYQFETDGTATGEFIATPFAPIFPADMAYNTRTGMLWQVAVGGDNCIHELDPGSTAATGNRICAPFGTSLRGVAYNPASDTYFVGTWNGGFVAEVDGSGTILRTRVVDIPVSGLAYNPRTGHLFAQVNDFVQLIYILDVNQDFKVLSAFPALGPTGPAFIPFEGAGLEIDCAGNLWAPNQAEGSVFVFTSGETETCISGIPWLDEAPATGSVAAFGSTPVSVQFNGNGQPTGCYEGQLVVGNDTPYGTSSLPVGITVQFKDVSPTTPGDRFIHAIAGADITHGCAFGRFCPANGFTRGTAAVWLLRSHLGTGYAPPPAKGIFADVPSESFGADYIEDFYNRGIITACSTEAPLRYCPSRALTKSKLAELLLKTSQGPTYSPPACTGIFRDVKCTNPLAPFVEDAFTRGWLDACVVRPMFKFFCPTRVERRWQAAEADAKAFGIPACKQ